MKPAITMSGTVDQQALIKYLEGQIEKNKEWDNMANSGYAKGYENGIRSALEAVKGNINLEEATYDPGKSK